MWIFNVTVSVRLMVGKQVTWNQKPRGSGIHTASHRLDGESSWEGLISTACLTSSDRMSEDILSPIKS